MSKFKMLDTNNIQVMYLYKSRGSMVNSTFDNNYVNQAAVALLRDNSVLKAVDLTVNNNNAVDQGGAFYVTD